MALGQEMNTLARQPPANMTGDGPKWMQSETKCDKCAVNRDSVAPHQPPPHPTPQPSPPPQPNGAKGNLGDLREAAWHIERRVHGRLLLSLHHCDKHTTLLALLSRSLVMFHYFHVVERGEKKQNYLKNLHLKMLLTFTVRRLVGSKMTFLKNKGRWKTRKLSVG